MQDQASPVELTLASLATRSERWFSHKRVVSMRAGERVETTYGELVGRARRVAGALDELGVGRGEVVASMAANTAGHLELLLGTACSGRILHALNPRLAPGALRSAFLDGGAGVLVVDASLRAVADRLVDELDTAPRVVVMADDQRSPGDADDSFDEMVAAAAARAWPDLDERSGAVLCHTSGTTGSPRGVLYSHRSIVLQAMALLGADAVGVSERDVLLPVVPVFHTNALCLPQAAMMAGADLVLGGGNFEPEWTVELIHREQVTLAAGAVTLWMRMLEPLARRGRGALRLVISGASAVPPTLIEAFESRLGLDLLQAWGMTETGTFGTISRPTSTRPGTTHAERAAIRTGIGIPLPGVDARIVGPDGGPLPHDGQRPGELQVRGSTVIASYWRTPPTPDAVTEDGWLRTGDVATIDEIGSVRIVDREKDLIKSGDEWISSVELEHRIVAHPDVMEVAVVAVPDRKWQERPLACVVCRPGATVELKDLHGLLEGDVPRWWFPDHLVVVEQLPRSATNKYDKKALRARYADLGDVPA